MTLPGFTHLEHRSTHSLLSLLPLQQMTLSITAEAGPEPGQTPGPGDNGAARWRGSTLPATRAFMRSSSELGQRVCFNTEAPVPRRVRFRVRASGWAHTNTKTCRQQERCSVFLRPSHSSFRVSFTSRYKCRTEKDNAKTYLTTEVYDMIHLWSSCTSVSHVRFLNKLRLLWFRNASLTKCSGVFLTLLVDNQYTHHEFRGHPVTHLL